MSEEKYDETKEASGFVMHELEVAKRVEELTRKDVKKVIEEYPGKKQELNEEKELVLELIDMVEDIKFSDEPSAKADPAQLQYIHSEISTIAGKSPPPRFRTTSMPADSALQGYVPHARVAASSSYATHMYMSQQATSYDTKKCRIVARTPAPRLCVKHMFVPCCRATQADETQGRVRATAAYQVTAEPN